jgi:hypothetical protein
MCRTIRPVVQKVLFKNLSLIADSLSACTLSSGPNGAQYMFRQLSRLAKTLQQRPDLATLVRDLVVNFTTGYCSHGYACIARFSAYNKFPDANHAKRRAECTCGVSHFTKSNAETFRGMSVCNDGWALRLRLALEPALIGLILALLPRLRSLSLNSDYHDDLNSNLEDMFDNYNGNLEDIAGLGNLEDLKNRPTCMWALNLPKLQTLDWYVYTSIGNIDPVSPATFQLTTLNLTLKFYLNNPKLNVIDAQAISQPGSILSMTKRMTDRLQALQNFHITVYEKFDRHKEIRKPEAALPA